MMTAQAHRLRLAELSRVDFYLDVLTDIELERIAGTCWECAERFTDLPAALFWTVMATNAASELRRREHNRLTTKPVESIKPSLLMVKWSGVEVAAAMIAVLALTRQTGCGWSANALRFFSKVQDKIILESNRRLLRMDASEQKEGYSN